MSERNQQSPAPSSNPKSDPLVIARLLEVDTALVERARLPLVAQHLRLAILLLRGTSAVETTTELTEAEKLLQAWADPLPPNGRLYWQHVEKAREYFKGRSPVKASAFRCPVTTVDCTRNCSPDRCAIAATP